MVGDRRFDLNGRKGQGTQRSDDGLGKSCQLFRSVNEFWYRISVGLNELDRLKQLVDRHRSRVVSETIKRIGCRVVRSTGAINLLDFRRSVRITDQI